MNAILEQVNSTGKIFVEFALPMLVQSSVLILILLLTDFALRRKVRAVFRYGIWLLVLIKLVLPTSLSVPLSLGYFFGDQLAYVDGTETTTETAQTAPAIVTPMINPPRTEAGSDTSAIAPTTPTIEPEVAKPTNPPIVPVALLSWQGAVFLAWLTVVLTMGLLLLQRAIFVRGLVAQAKESNSMMADTLESCRERMGVKRKIVLKVSTNATSPAVCGLFRPVILVPQNLTSSLNPSQLRAVLLHELAHIRRGDLWVNLAQTILQIIYFYNPLLWLANCVIRRVREQAVDEMVLVTMGEKAQQYPQTLVNVAKLSFKRPALSLRLIGVVESKSALAGRIKHILNRPMPKKAKLGILGLAVVIITAAILLPMATCTPGTPGLVIKGTVKDAQTGKPIAGARVFDDGYGPKPNWEQIKADERSEWGAITNSAGEYSFLTWPEHHSIKVEAPGYKAKRQSLYDGHFVFKTKDEEIFDFALEPEKATYSSEFKKTLPNGVTVELIGICEHPSEGKQWWKPDGSLLEDRPYDKGNTHSGGRGSKYELAFRIVNLPDSAFGWMIKSKEITLSALSEVGKDGRDVPDITSAVVGFKEKSDKKDIGLGIAVGPWTGFGHHITGGITTTSDGIVFQRAVQDSEGNIVLNIIHNINQSEKSYRVVAIGKNGTEYKAHYSGGVSRPAQPTITETVFNNLKINDVKEFFFQTRPYEWCEFKNVSLKPNFKTDVQVEVEGESEVSKLLASLEDEKYAHTRGGIIPLVEEIGNKEPTSFLVEQLQAESRRRRCKAALVLELLGDRRGVPVIIKELNDTSYRPTTRIKSDGTEYQEGQVRQDHYYAALLLGISGDKRAVPTLIEATRDEEINYQAAISLGQIGDMRAVPALRAMLEKYSNEPFVRLFAGYGLAMLNDEEGLRVVIDTLNNQELHWVDRRHAIRALGELRNKQAVPHLIVALKDDHPNIRVSAARALGAIGDLSALPALKQALEDKTETKVNAPTTVSKAAAEAIAQIRTKGRKAAVQVGPEPIAGDWQDIGKAIPTDCNETILLAEHITLDSIGQDVEGKTFITLLRDRVKTKNKQYRFILVRSDGRVVEPAGYKTLVFVDQLWERFSFDMPYRHRQIKEFRLQSFPQNLERKASLPVVNPYDPDVNGKIAAQATSGPPGRGALRFDGQNDYLYVPDSQSLWLETPFTVEIWIKPEFPKEELENWPSWGLISKGCTIGTGRVKTRGFGITLNRFKDEPNLLMVHYCTADDNGIYGKPYGRRDFDDWIHLYHVFSHERYEPGLGHPLVVGKFIILENPFAGQIGEIRIWSGARSRDQISEYRNKPLTGDEPGLVASWTFEQSGGQIAYDISSNRNHARLGRTTDTDDADPTWVTVTGGSTIDKEPGNAPISEANKENKKLQEPNEPSYDGRSLTELIAALGDQDFQTRIKAVYHLGYMGPKAKPAVPALVDALDEERLRESVLHSLGNIGVGAEEAIPALIKAIAKYAPACRWMAAESLAKIGKAAVPPLKKAAGSEDIYLQIWCNAALAKQQGSDSPNLRYMAQLMKNADKRTAGEAVSALTMLGPISKPLVPDLIEALKHSVVPKKHIASALARIGKDAGPAVPELTKMLKDTDLWTRADVISAFSRIGGPDVAPAVPLLIQALKTNDTSNTVMASRVRYTAATALGNVGPDARPALPALVIALGDKDEFVRANSAKAIGDINPTDMQAVPALLEAMKDESGRVRVAATQTLLKIGPVNKEVVLAFIEAANDNWKGVITARETFFSFLGPQHSYLIPDLIGMLKTPNERAQRLAIMALGNMGEAAAPAVPYIVDSMKNSRLEGIASGALRKLGPKAKAAVPELIKMLGDKRKRFSAAPVLETIGPEAREAIPALENCLGQNRFVLYARALLAINPKSEKAIQQLVRVAESAYVPAQWTEQPDAHYLLVKYGHEGNRHLQSLIDALENPNSRIRLSAAAYLGNLGAKANEAAESLGKALKDDDPEVRAMVARAILLISVKSSERKVACNILFDLLDGKDFTSHDGLFMAQVRAAGALASFGPLEEWTVPLLIANVQDGSIRTRMAAIKAFGNIGPGAKEAIPYLKRLLKAEDWQIRHSAAQAIEKIDKKTDVQVEGEKLQSLIFHGLDLTTVPHTTNSSKLPDLFEARPPGSKSYHIQKDVTPIYSGLDRTVYFIPRRNIFYVQHDKLGSSTLTYYGPFEGNPVQVLNLQPDVQAERETNNRAELNAAPVEIQAIGKVLKEWFENCAAGDLEEVKKAYLPSVNKKAERDLQQIERFLEVVPDWQFSLLGVMWDGNKATAVSNVLKGLKDPAAIISGPVVWICHLNKLDGQWWLANNVAGERLEKFQQYVAQSKEKNPNLNMWLNHSYSSLLQETNVLKDKAEAFEKGEWKQLDGAPKEAQDIGEVLRRWFGGCLAGDLEQVKATYTPNNRERAEKQLKEIREYMTITPADWQFSPMIIKIGDSRAEAISNEFVITFNHPENTGDPAVLIVHLMKVDAQWGILYSSGDSLRNVSYAHFKRKYPQSRIWFDKSIPDWLKPDQQTKTDISIEDITSSVPEIKAEQTLAEKLRELNNDREIFESYFPDSTEGGKVLDDWWKVKDKEQRSDEEIVSIIRNGLRRTGNGELRDHKDRFTGWIGQKYIWKKGPKNKQAVELMYYASFDPDLTANTVYYGLSVAGDEQSPKLLNRLVDICMSNIYVTRILWGAKGKHDRMIEYLEPYLNSLDQQIRQRAVVLEKALKGEIDYGQWEKEQYRKKRQEEFGDQLSQIREVLLKGNSKQRSEMFDLIKRKGLYILVDDSFKEPLIACLKDDHPVVKEAALRLSGGVLLKKNEQSPEIFELMSNLSNDWDHKVRNEAAKFIGIHWIWGAKPQKPEAIEIMLRLSKDKDRGVRYQAVYYGLSVVENKDERIVKRLVEMALDKTNDFGRISWGLSRGADKKMIKKHLKPYLGLESKKSELARQLYIEIFKEELPEI